MIESLRFVFPEGWEQGRIRVGWRCTTTLSDSNRYVDSLLLPTTRLFILPWRLDLPCGPDAPPRKAENKQPSYYRNRSASQTSGTCRTLVTLLLTIAFYRYMFYAKSQVWYSLGYLARCSWSSFCCATRCGGSSWYTSVKSDSSLGGLRFSASSMARRTAVFSWSARACLS